MELVSVITPVYNGERYLEQTIQSVLNQTYKNIEYILIDDCSQDSSLAIIEKYRDKVVICRNNKNLGIIRTVNEGIKKAKGKYIMLLGHDDLVEPDHVEKLLLDFDEDTSLVFCSHILIDKDNKKTQSRSGSTWINKALQNPLFELAKSNFISCCGIILSKEKVEKVGLFEEIDDFPNYGEWLLWIKLAAVGKIKYNREKKALYRRHETNITNTFEDKLVKKNLQKYYKLCRKTAYKLGNFTVFQRMELLAYHLLYYLRY